MSENNRIEEIIYEVFSLYENRGGENYIGERVTQLEHATQCAMLAEQEGYSDDVGNLGTLLRRHMRFNRTSQAWASAGGGRMPPLEFENDDVICCSPVKCPKFFARAFGYNIIKTNFSE